MPTWVTPCSASQALSASSSRVVVPKRRSSFCGLRPGTPIRMQQTTLAWCTSRPAQRSRRASIVTTCQEERGDDRCAAGEVRYCCSCSPRSAATKDDAWEQRGPICWTGLHHPVSVGLQAATRSGVIALPATSQRSPAFPLHDGARPRAAHLLANSPDWLKAAPMRENLLASWRQFGQKQDPCPSLLNHNATYKRLLSSYCDFANGVRPFLVDTQEIGKELRHGLGSRYKKTVARSSACDIDLFDLFETCVVGS